MVRACQPRFRFSWLLGLQNGCKLLPKKQRNHEGVARTKGTISELSSATLWQPCHKLTLVFEPGRSLV